MSNFSLSHWCSVNHWGDHEVWHKAGRCNSLSLTWDKPDFLLDWIWSPACYWLHLLPPLPLWRGSTDLGRLDPTLPLQHAPTSPVWPPYWLGTPDRETGWWYHHADTSPAARIQGTAGIPLPPFLNLTFSFWQHGLFYSQWAKFWGV